MHDEVSITRQLRREATFSPPYCPRPSCRYHLRGEANFARRHGYKAIKRFPYAAQRFQCKTCAKTFSASFFELYYRQKVWGFNERIWDEHRKGVAKCEIARGIARSEKLVRLRIRNMSRFGELKHASLSQHLAIEEPIVYDGLENFSYSQYDPNNINHAVGKNSLFIYDFNLSPLNRKGRMSGRQKARKRLLEKKYGKYPSDAIRTSTKRIFERLLLRSRDRLVLFTDRHFQYRRVVEWDLKGKPISHIKVSSKIHRNYRNHLFAVNNVDMQARHNLATFKRETIAFSKHEIAMQDSFLLYAIYRNYMRPKFWAKHRSDPECSKRSPAMELKITHKILSFQDFFSERVLPTQVKLNEDAVDRYRRHAATSRRLVAPAPAF